MNSNFESLSQQGFTIFRSFFEEKFLKILSDSIDNSYENCRKIQISNGIGEVTDGTVHHLLASENSVYIDVLEKIFENFGDDFIKKYFHGNCIVNSYGGVINLTSKPSYVANVHRDIRFFSGEFPLMLNMLIMIDDFTLENGATYLLAKSHLKKERPNDDFFYEKSVRATGKKGDVIFFNSNLWHAAGINLTQEKRRAITITFTKPFMKQQLDYSRAIGYEKVENMSETLQQIVGYYSRIPSNLEEWYQKPEKRFYRPGQD